MGNLSGKFRIDFLNFNGTIDKRNGTINYFDFMSLTYEIIKKIDEIELKNIFDTFYGGEFLKKDETLILLDIPIRILYFETEGISKIIGIGHVQKDSWICKFQDEVVSKDFITKKYVDTCLKDIMHEFPRSLDKFMHIFENNPYEICELLNLKDVSPFDISQIFKEAFKNMSGMFN